MQFRLTACPAGRAFYDTDARGVATAVKRFVQAELLSAEAATYLRSISFFMSSVIGMTSKSLKYISQSVPPCI
ncbi:hypothetical protein Poly24_05500 [Rosistilla carotiformis]|uniref:Uncharacterized protein n=1 Tax=Rosistilla carotiformis TaxID=2528017 RepID=A0A518JMU3_9BACT|nr:hypothetical protein Poly24_05500 [Rosistilla carotiformis]